MSLTPRTPWAYAPPAPDRVRFDALDFDTW
jgi:hypothetical protein